MRRIFVNNQNFIWIIQIVDATEDLHRAAVAAQMATDEMIAKGTTSFERKFFTSKNLIGFAKKLLKNETTIKNSKIVSFSKENR